MKKPFYFILSVVIVLVATAGFYHFYTVKELEKVEVIPNYYNEGDSVHGEFTVNNNSKYPVVVFYKENKDDEYKILTSYCDGYPSMISSCNSGKKFGYMYKADDAKQAESDVQELKNSTLYIKIKTESTTFTKQIEKEIR